MIDVVKDSSRDEIEDKIILAGRIGGQVRREGVARICEGTTYLEVMDYCERRIVELGGGIAWAQMAVNDIAAHYCPEQDDVGVFKVGDLVKIDIGVHIDGYIADNAMTVEVGSVTGVRQELIKTSQNALRAAIKLVRPGVQLWELGEAQTSETEKAGFQIVRNLAGHSIEQYRVHAGISIPTYNSKEKTQLVEGMQIAIEPFITNGVGLIKEGNNPSIFMVANKRMPRSPYARKILEQVAPQNGLPFTTRWLTRTLGKGPALLGLRELLREGIVRAYPPLPEVKGGLVAQFEHSMIVKDKTLVYTRHEDDTW